MDFFYGLTCNFRATIDTSGADVHYPSRAIAVVLESPIALNPSGSVAEGS